jgi:very-short-patch-repair endonuclease
METSLNAKFLRQNQTEAEKVLWHRLRNRRLAGYKFRRQVSIGPYIADFVCAGSRLIVEVDGGQHSQQAEYDRRRDDFLTGVGYKVVRYWNNEVLSNLDGVLEALTLTLSQREREVRDEDAKTCNEATEMYTNSHRLSDIIRIEAKDNGADGIA